MERLDGNAAAGVLLEVFAREMTTAMETCANCGRSSVLGAVHVYMDAPGTVLRCPTCEAVLMAIVRTRDDLHVDLSGLHRIELR
jgi:ribosomal protein S27AE